MNWLDGHVALVTGGASGLGRSIVKRFVEEGARVAVLDRSSEKLEALTREFGAEVIPCCGDVRNYEDNLSAVSNALKTFGRLDAFIGNAGIWDYQTALADIDPDCLDEAFNEVMGINLLGAMKGARAALPALLEARGSVVLTLSNASFYVNGGGILYTASKFAGVGVVRQLAFEFAPHVRVNGVAPGPLQSDLRGPQSLGLADQSITSLPMADLVAQHSPLPDMPRGEDYASAYVLLASSRHSRATTGAILNVDGGVGVRGLVEPAGGNGLLERFCEGSGE
ncbi:3-(cis-5,6-dihydroxycyclohexa-1,3-dien-1-yl)propanoate dehydrogenase [Parvibaculum sp.]|uniref:3-(cis-5,6-dihydroxycyclohexa-1, 3-dien-1-yl)propanoate dehydrogenase n=1 Tax=Parvibaculum sp. TaxID=2024848 RepID=UPI000C963771|nr:3-(cis-5,6-dihydroxycyclohexa-1,3-dien-1-yl)propanoate dehydrogenase [Parvibaculum sp.]MAB14328.1 3-(cis-5,6-dihydroxycyclohexa-1,3-dien-1-yl)propanoate dehydrogenase [Parvibaculum sp.]